MPLNLRVVPGCVWVTFSKGIGGGAGSNFAFLLVEINQSWESRLLAVKGPGGGCLRKEGSRAKVKGRVTGCRALAPAAGAAPVELRGGAHTAPLPAGVPVIIPALLCLGTGSKPLE